ncbi:MAG: hypothetical protein JW861_00490 [Bacteroidales bacterium]|nr:hypothetical protein [Bacteroidales bacterium]
MAAKSIFSSLDRKVSDYLIRISSLEQEVKEMKALRDELKTQLERKESELKKSIEKQERLEDDLKGLHQELKRLRNGSRDKKS